MSAAREDRICDSVAKQFWLTAQPKYGGGELRFKCTVLNQSLLVSETSIRIGLQLGDDSDDVVVLSSRVIRETLQSIGYRDEFKRY
jgi:hypothetical protein